ncbi:hypothetical protein KXW65_003486 [Aspergillus fumigatus]|nr:hypothetical protein CNMCM8686_006145 [Aspergillus fumigatus]KAH1448030.1 hypothetical protein KXX58_005943 [Aspergillus fumigatus]KAH2021104.1 hypothetical protein KXV65_002942 [Aspergillus fumigatus]KAH2056037.1 hypothetical protein KXW51_001482 [Aspergillus fumigatus]KAH2113680.1 hypothetical protein KXW65_003486 [Aspergillus fumigatus]
MNRIHLLTKLFRRNFSASPFHRQLDPFTRRLFKLPSPPPSPSQHHNDLASFLAHAERTALPTTSTTYIGTHYEYTVQQTLRHFAFSLHRVGGRDDAGVDLVGTWHLPQHEHPLRVFVQCKALKTKLGPNLVRELEGTFRRSPVGWRTGTKIGILVGPREATKGVRDATARSAYPLLWMMVERNGELHQALWNGCAVDLGLGALGVEMVYGVGALGRRIRLTWDGSELPSMDQVEDLMMQRQNEWLRLWDADSEMSAARRGELLDLVQQLYPDEKPLLLGAGTCTTLTETDRSKVLQLLRNRLQTPAENTESSA